MPKERYNAEEIIHKLREADVLLSQEKTVSQACKQLGVSDQTYYRWRRPLDPLTPGFRFEQYRLSRREGDGDGPAWGNPVRRRDTWT